MKQESNNRSSSEKDFPGYPHYPANEDITKPGNNNGKVNANEENIALPDVNDIPGQENIIPMPLGELADTTISSADEEDIVNGDSLDAEDDEVRIVIGTEADVTEEDLLLLGAKGQDMDLNEDEDLNRSHSMLDETDDDGDPLNENATGADLDVPGSEEDDANEDIGEEDEENNYYSRSQNDGENTEDTEGIP
jgi:hypothetical protein